MKNIVSFYTKVGGGVPVRVAPRSRSVTFPAGRLLVLLACVLSAAIAREPGFAEFRAVQESLRLVHPRFVPRWLKEHGYDPADFMPRPWAKSDSLGLVLKGKWGRGRSVEVTGQDSLVFLSLGSEIAILSFSDPAQPRILTELQLGFCPTQTYVADSLLVTGGYSCIETWSLSDISHPAFRGRIPYRVGDFCVGDSFLYFVSYDDDSFRVWSIADPAAPRQLGACRDSGWATTVSGNTVVLVLHDGFGFMDVSNPHAPTRVGTYGGNSIAAKARGTICCITNDEGGSPATASFEVLDISNPASPVRLSKLSASGGYDIELADTLAFVSGWQQTYGDFSIIGISDSTHPHKLSTYATPGDNWGVWASPARHRAFIADWRRGLCVLDISSLANPVLDTTMLVADQAEDIYVRGSLAYVADYGGGLRILDVSDPARPTEWGGIDSAGATCWSVVTADSFAFVGWRPSPYFRTVCISDPARPTFVGSCNPFEFARDMVIRDSFVYCAEAYRFQVVNVARPRQPVLVGSCGAGDATSAGLCVKDTLAFVASAVTQIFNISNPVNPTLVGQFGRGAWNIAVVDSVAFLATGVLVWYNVANPAALFAIDSINLGRTVYGIAVNDTLVYAATLVGEIYTVSVADLHAPYVVGHTTVPDLAWRLEYERPHVYAACFGGGVCIFDTTTAGIGEARSAPILTDDLRVVTSPVHDQVIVRIRNANRKEVMCDAYTAAGTLVPVAASVSVGGGWTKLRLDLRSVASGVYLLRIRVGETAHSLRVVKL